MVLNIQNGCQESDRFYNGCQNGCQESDRFYNGCQNGCQENHWFGAHAIPAARRILSLGAHTFPAARWLLKFCAHRCAHSCRTDFARIRIFFSWVLLRLPSRTPADKLASLGDKVAVNMFERFCNCISGAGLGSSVAGFGPV